MNPDQDATTLATTLTRFGDRWLRWLDEWILRGVRAHWALGLASLVGLGLLAARTLWVRNGMFLFLAWNLALAWMPVALAHVVLHSRQAPSGGPTLRRLAAVAWLLFLPNAPYLVTDLVHLTHRPPAPLWLDGLLLIHFAWLGLMLGFASLRLLQLELTRWMGVRVGWAFAAGALALASFGIYLGRFRRWNSWDVLLSPLDMGTEILSRISQPWEHPRAWGFTVVCAAVLSLAYLMVGEVGGVSVAERRRENAGETRRSGSAA